jgi:HK97 gp10 family phage protein
MKVRLRNLPTLKTALARISKSIEEEAGRLLEEGAEVVATEARSRAPVKEGDLLRSIRVGKPPKKEADALAWAVGTDIEYAKAIEFGYRGSEAQPYLFPAMEAKRKEVVDQLLTQGLRAKIRRGAFK